MISRWFRRPEGERTSIDHHTPSRGLPTHAAIVASVAPAPAHHAEADLPTAAPSARPVSDAGRAAAGPPAAADPRGAPAPDDAALHRLLDTVGALVQLVGACAVDTDARDADAVRVAADRWRRHLTTGLAHPAALDGDAPGDAAGVPPIGAPIAARDWTGAVRWATGERQAERAHVQRLTGGLRDAVWTLLQGLHRVVGAEAQAGRATDAALVEVERAIRDSDPELVRGAALEALGRLAGTIGERERARERRLAELGAEVQALGAALDEARRESASDALTGLGNRRAFDAALAHAVALAALVREPVTLLLIDVDGLKPINDRCGHQAGDEALRRVAAQLSRTFLRRSDVLARIGGDEFAVVLRDVGAEEGARAAGRLVEAVQRAGTVAAEATGAAPLGVSVGVAALRDGEEAAAWVARADAALYAAKRAGKGRVERGD